MIAPRGGSRADGPLLIPMEGVDVPAPALIRAVIRIADKWAALSYVALISGIPKGRLREIGGGANMTEIESRVLYSHVVS